MAATGRTTESTTAAVESATFVRVVSRADGDALAASGVLARALSAVGRPFQVSVARTVGERTRRAGDGDDLDDRETTVVVGRSDADAIHLDPADRPASLAAHDLAAALGADPDRVLALAGAFAADVDLPGSGPDETGTGETERLVEAARERGRLESRPGVAIPTRDLVDGLAHSTLVRAPWSGDPEATGEALASAGVVDAEEIDEGGGTAVDDDPTGGDDVTRDIETATGDAETGTQDAETATQDDENVARGDEKTARIDEDVHRRVASLVAIDAVGAESATATAAERIGRVLGPDATPETPFATVGGLADVLRATARSAPGTGVALAMGHDVRTAALEAWREHGRRVHAALGGASTRRYDGLSVVDVDDGPVETVARLAITYRSNEPAVLVVGDGEVGVATAEDRPIGTVLEAIDGDLDLAADHDVGRRRGYLRWDAENADTDEIVDAARGVL